MARKSISAAVIAVATLAVAACGGSDTQETTTPDPTPVGDSSSDTNDNDSSDTGSDLGDTGPTDTGTDLEEVIYFEFDSSTLSDRARSQLQQNAEWLREDSSRRITIEGHTDEVGTPEYNLALGERRARSAQQYLIQLGIAEGRIEIVTFGEERPASDDDAENRRSVFVPLN